MEEGESHKKENISFFPGVRFLSPQKIVNDLEIFPEMKVAHFGCGAGYFTFAVAEKMKRTGTVYALDILPEKIEAVKSQARLQGFSNVLARRVNLEEKEGSKISGESLDWVLIVNMLFQNEAKNKIIGEAKRILKVGGRILIVDWKSISGTIGPEMKKRVPREEVIKISRKFALRLAREIELDSFHFGLVLAK